MLKNWTIIKEETGYLTNLRNTSKKYLNLLKKCIWGEIPSQPYFHLKDYCSVYDDKGINFDIKDNLVTLLFEEIHIYAFSNQSPLSTIFTIKNS
jgi:hypothetical protein